DRLAGLYYVVHEVADTVDNVIHKAHVAHPPLGPHRRVLATMCWSEGVPGVVNTTGGSAVPRRAAGIPNRTPTDPRTGRSRPFTSSMKDPIAAETQRRPGRCSWWASG